MDNISHLKSSRIASLWGGVNPSGQPDRFFTVFFLTASLSEVVQNGYFTTILRILKKSKWERAFHLGGHHLSKLLVVDGAVKTDQVIKLSALILSFGKKTFIQPTHPLLSTSAFAIISSSLWSDMPGLKNEPILIFFQEQIYLKTCSKLPQEIVGFIESRWEIGNAREPVDESKQSYNF